MSEIYHNHLFDESCLDDCPLNDNYNKHIKTLKNYNNKGQKKMKKTMTRRYYIGSTHLTDQMENTGKCEYYGTLSEKINEAKERIESGREDVIYIVEIIKIIRKVPIRTTEVIVEDVV